jgi:outer membrane lipoprotein-sorting protein
MLGNKRTVVAAVLLAVVAMPCVAATIEEVEKELTAAIKKTESMKGKMKTDINASFQGFEMTSVSEATLETLREGDKFKMRSEGSAKSTQKMGGTEQKKEQTMLTICDGEFTYSLSESDGTKNVTKTKAVTGEELPWAHYGKDVQLKVLPDEKVDGADCYVVEMKMAPGAPGAGMGKMVFYCRKDCGMQIKIVGYTPEDKVMMTTVVTDIELNKSIDASRFVFKAPEGVEIMDMTKSETP